MYRSVKPIIEAKELAHEYFRRDEEGNVTGINRALDGISLQIKEGDFIAVLGANGSGKSTFARHINALLKPTEGTLYVGGMDCAKTGNELDIRRVAGMVFQNPDNQIIGSSLEEDTAFGPEQRALPSERIRQLVRAGLQRVGLWERRKDSPMHLSGGEKQRLAIAGALAGEPRCLVLDEPTAMLDPQARREVLELVSRLNREAGMTVILITHHPDEALLADELFLMEKGQILAAGPPRTLLADRALLQRLDLRAPTLLELSLRLRDWGLPMAEPPVNQAEWLALLQALALRRVESGMSLVSDLQSELGPAVSETAAETVLAVDDLAFAYGKKQLRREVLHELQFSLQEGECLALIGASGSGKSTLARLLNGLLRPDRGTVRYRGQPVDGKAFPLHRLRQEVGLVFQYPERQLFASTVLQDVCFGPLNLGLDPEEAKRRARESLRLMGISETLESRSPFDLSGGEQRRVAIAGVLAMEPRVLILDEPSAGLDAGSKERLFATIAEIRRQRKLAVVLITHDMEEAAMADRILVLEQGRKRFDGRPVALYQEQPMLRELGLDVPSIPGLAAALDEILGSVTDERIKAQLRPLSGLRTALNVDVATRLLQQWWRPQHD